MHSVAPPLRFYRGDLTAAALALALTAAFAVLTFLDVLGDWTMKLGVRLAAIVAVAFLVTGCTGFGRAAIPRLPQMDVGVVHDVKCADLIKAVRQAAANVAQHQAEAGAGLPTDVEGLRRRNTDLQVQLAQTDAMVAWCEARSTDARVKIDLEAARKAGLAGLLP